MIEFKYPEEEEILLHYASIMDCSRAAEILKNRKASNNAEAEILAKLYWDMLDIAADDQGKGVPILEKEGIEFWMEQIFHSLNGYFVSNGYEEQWDSE